MTQPQYLRSIYKPYPLITSFWQLINIGLFIGLFVFIFLLAFQPFGLSQFTVNKNLIIGGYGVITFLISTILSLLASQLFNESKWTTLHQMVFYLILLIGLSIANYYYTKTINRQINLSLSHFVFYTLSVASFPLTFVTLMFQKQQEKKHQLESAKVNRVLLNPETLTKPLKEELSIKTVSGVSILILPENVLFIESEGNYLLIHHLKEGKVVETKTRGTIKAMTTKLDSVFQKTHRAFIVNTKFISQAKGNAQGLRLTIKNTNKEVLVSRNFVKQFRKHLEN